MYKRDGVCVGGGGHNITKVKSRNIGSIEDGADGQENGVSNSNPH